MFHLGGPHCFFFLIFPKKIYTLLILFLISFFRLRLMREKQLASPLASLFLLHIAQLNSHKREDNFLIRNEQFFFLLLLTLRSVVFWILAIFNSFALHWVSQRLWFPRISYVKLKFVSVAAINYARERSKCLFSNFNALCLQISYLFQPLPTIYLFCPGRNFICCFSPKAGEIFIAVIKYWTANSFGVFRGDEKFGRKEEEKN